MKHLAALLTLALVLLPVQAQPGKIIDQKPVLASPLDIKLPDKLLAVFDEMGAAAKQMKISAINLEHGSLQAAWYDGMFRGAVGMGIVCILLYLGVDKWRSKAP